MATGRKNNYIKKEIKHEKNINTQLYTAYNSADDKNNRTAQYQKNKKNGRREN